jgi:hypothetical protein
MYMQWFQLNAFSKQEKVKYHVRSKDGGCIVDQRGIKIWERPQQVFLQCGEHFDFDLGTGFVMSHLKEFIKMYIYNFV